MFDPSKYQSQPSLKTSHESDSWASRGGFIGMLRAFAESAFHWYLIKLLGYGTLLIVTAWAGVNWSQKDLEETSNHIASGGVKPVMEKLVDLKNLAQNNHPIFSSPEAKDFKEKVGAEMRDIYQYAKLGEKEIFVMKDVWFKDSKPLEIEYSNLVYEDAIELCDQHNAFVATAEDVGAANVVKRPNEGFMKLGDDDGWKGKKMFRCVIDLGGAE